jgi:hypothetical protein
MARDSRFSPRHNLPTEALWRLVEPMLIREHDATGYSIVNHPGWSLLNLYPQKSIHAGERDIEEKFNILLELSCNHYINFQAAGTVWNITRDEKGQ